MSYQSDLCDLFTFSPVITEAPASMAHMKLVPYETCFDIARLLESYSEQGFSPADTHYRINVFERCTMWALSHKLCKISNSYFDIGPFQFGSKLVKITNKSRQIKGGDVKAGVSGPRLGRLLNGKEHWSAPDITREVFRYLRDKIRNELNGDMEGIFFFVGQSNDAYTFVQLPASFFIKDYTWQKKRPDGAVWAGDEDRCVTITFQSHRIDIIVPIIEPIIVPRSGLMVNRDDAKALFEAK